MRKKSNYQETTAVSGRNVNVVLRLIADVRLVVMSNCHHFHNNGVHDLLMRYSDHRYDNNLYLFRCLALFGGESLESCQRAEKRNFTSIVMHLT